MASRRGQKRHRCGWCNAEGEEKDMLRVVRHGRKRWAHVNCYKLFRNIPW